MNADVCLIAFQLEVEGILQSEIMQVFTMDAVKEITEIMLADQGEVLAPVERKHEERRATASFAGRSGCGSDSKTCFSGIA